MRHFYLAHGYADVRVRSAASYDAAKKGVVLTFTVDEGAQYRFGKIDINPRMKSRRHTRCAYLHTQAGDIYDADAVNKTVDDSRDPARQKR